MGIEYATYTEFFVQIRRYFFGECSFCTFSRPMKTWKTHQTYINKPLMCIQVQIVKNLIFCDFLVQVLFFVKSLTPFPSRSWSRAEKLSLGIDVALMGLLMCKIWKNSISRYFSRFWIGFFMTFFGMEVSHVALYSTRLKRRYHIINKKYMISLKKLSWPWNHHHHCIYIKPMHSVTVCSAEHHVSCPSVLKYFCRNNFFITLLAYGIVIRSQLTHNQTYCKQWLCGSQIRVWQI